MYDFHSAGTSSSNMIADTGHAISQAAQSMHCAGLM
jgi:hypothetical protein